MVLRNSLSGVRRLVPCAAVLLTLLGTTGQSEARMYRWFYRHAAVSHRHVAMRHRASHPVVRHVDFTQTTPMFAAMVVDANDGRVLYAANQDAPRHPASITKVMTLYLLFEALEKGRLRLDSPLTVSAHAAAQSPTKLGLRPGSQITVENAIKAIVTKSANDMAVTVAEALGGDEESFAEAMTAKARQLGMVHTFYHNASGLPDMRQITTARDLTILGRAIHDRFPRYYRYFSTPSFTYAGSFMPNHNHLLGRIDGMDGIKTGYTGASGFNLLSSVTRGGRHIVAVVLGGRTAGGRDRIMASLIEGHIEEASITPATRFAEGRPVETAAPTPRPQVVAEADRGEDLAAADGEGDAPDLPPPPPRPVARAPRVASLIAPDLALPPPVAGPVERARATAPQPVRAQVALAQIAPPQAAPAPTVPPAPLFAPPTPPAPPPAAAAVVVPAPSPIQRVPKEKARPAFIAGAQKIADGAAGTTGAPDRRRVAADGSTGRRDVAARDGRATTTPSSLRWVTGAQPVRFGPAAGMPRAALALADQPTGSIEKPAADDETKIARTDKGNEKTAERPHDIVPGPAPAHGGWMIQIGATDDAEKANALLNRAKAEGRAALASARPFTEKVQKGDTTLYRARFAGLEPAEAEAACRTLKRSGFACFATHN